MGARTQETGGNDWGVPRGHGQESGGRAESGCVLKTRKTGESAPLDPEGGSPSLFRSAPSLGSIDGAAGVFTPERDRPGTLRQPARLLVGRAVIARNSARAGAGPPLSGKPVFHSERLSDMPALRDLPHRRIAASGCSTPAFASPIIRETVSAPRPFRGPRRSGKLELNMATLLFAPQPLAYARGSVRRRFGAANVRERMRNYL